MSATRKTDPPAPNGKSPVYDALALFSGGLDSILACKVVQDQGKRVLGLHFVTPFFGKPRAGGFWRRVYGVDTAMIDMSEDYVDMLAQGPAHGFGKFLNPCVDCKILMLRRARELMAQYGASFLISGEVVGQRPMSQRKDTLNLIRNRAGVGEVLVRPLCAKRLDPTPVELAGLVDRERLGDIWGRGRKEQLRLANEVYGFEEVPTPAGGCLLTEPETAARFWMLLRAKPRPAVADFQLSLVGRQFFARTEEGTTWLALGRNKQDNDKLADMVRPGDCVFTVRDFPGPMALGRPLTGPWTAVDVLNAAGLVAGYSPKAMRAGGEVAVVVARDGAEQAVLVPPDRNPLGWSEPGLDEEEFKHWKMERVGQGTGQKAGKKAGQDRSEGGKGE